MPNSIDADHGQISERLVELLQSVDRPGDYCTGGKLYVPMPRVTVRGVGDLAFPIPDAQIDALINLAERAPFGKGTETITDTSVRDCWQIDANQIQVTGGAWTDTFKKIMKLVNEGLGIDSGKIGAKLYKLLIYGEGGFFAAHRDTEKVPGMIATLSLSLPTSSEGGELTISHAGKEIVYDMGAYEPSELSYAAFYADCLHETHPVTKGHRISLVYNLFIQSGKKWTGAPDYGELTDKVTESLLNWIESGKTEKKIWLLEHSYSEEGLSFNTLKGTDIAVAQILGEAAEKVNCAMYAAVLNIQETGDPEIDYEVGRWNMEPLIDSEIAVLHDRSQHLEKWVARDGSHPSLGSIQLYDGEVLQPELLKDMYPDEELLEDYMGNYGPTLDLIYRFAALVVWPKARTVEILSRSNISGAVSWASTQLEEMSGAEMHRALSDIADRWPETVNRFSDNNMPEMIRLITVAGHVDLAKKFLDPVILNHYKGNENASLAELLPMIGPKIANEFLQKMIRQYMLLRPKEILSLLALTFENLDTSESQWYDVALKIVRSAVATLPSILEEIAKVLDTRKAYVMSGGSSSYISKDAVEKQSLDSFAVCNLLALILNLNLNQESLEVVHQMMNSPRLVSPYRILPNALNALNKIEHIKGSQAYRSLWGHSVDFLLRRSRTPPVEPTDWAINIEISDTDELASDLKDFCLNPTLRTTRFSVKRDLRKHLRKLIDLLELNIDYVTERKGRPYSLICTKNRGNYERRLREYAEDVRYFDLLLEIVPQNGMKIKQAERVQDLEAAKAAFQEN